MTDLEVYFVETTRNQVELAEKFYLQNRKAAAQEALREARYWAFKCVPESLFDISDRITKLENQLY